MEPGLIGYEVCATGASSSRRSIETLEKHYTTAAAGNGDCVVPHDQSRSNLTPIGLVHKDVGTPIGLLHKEVGFSSVGSWQLISWRLRFVYTTRCARCLPTFFLNDSALRLTGSLRSAHVSHGAQCCTVLPARVARSIPAQVPARTASAHLWRAQKRPVRHYKSGGRPARGPARPCPAMHQPRLRLPLSNGTQLRGVGGSALCCICAGPARSHRWGVGALTDWRLRCAHTRGPRRAKHSQHACGRHDAGAAARLCPSTAPCVNLWTIPVRSRPLAVGAATWRVGVAYLLYLVRGGRVAATHDSTKVLTKVQYSSVCNTT